MKGNACDLALFGGGDAIAPSEVFPRVIAPGDFVALFAGAHGRANGLGAVIDAARELAGRGRTDIKILLIGEGAEKAQLKAAAGDLPNVIFGDGVPKTMLARIMQGCDVGLQILADIPAFYNGTSPNKFFDYLAAGRPVLINYPGWLAEYVGAERCGWAVPPRRPDLFAEALIAAADAPGPRRDMGLRARALAEKDFDRRLLAGRFVDAVTGVSRARSRGSATPAVSAG